LKNTGDKVSEEKKKCPLCGENNPVDTVQCEHCGEHIDESASPSTSHDTGEEAETTLWTGRPSYISYMTRYIFGAIFIALGSLHWFFLGWGVVLGAALLLFPIFSRNSTVYIVTNRRIRAKANIHRYSDEILIRDITSISLQQGPVEKLFGLGTVKIRLEDMAEDESDAEDEEEVNPIIEFRGIANPRQIMEKIEGLRAT
jgi:hypothetical protein